LEICPALASGAVISLIAILVIIHFVDLNRFIAAVRSANYWLILLSIPVSIVWLMVRGIVCDAVGGGFYRMFSGPCVKDTC